MRVAAALGLFCVFANGVCFRRPSSILSGLGYSAMKLGGCKNVEEVGEELELVSNYTTRIRLYGNECSQVKLVFDAIKQRKLRLGVLVGLWTRSRNLVAETDKLALMLKADINFPPLVIGVTVGNEDVFNGVPQAEVINNIRQVRMRMIQHGFQNISISTAEVGHLWTKELAHASDVVYANIYSFFSRRSNTPNMTMAAKSVVKQAHKVASLVAGNKQLVISETGWPSAGNPSLEYFDDPSIENQKTFLELLICNAKQHQFEFFALEAFDATWKPGPSIEANFGILNKQGSFKAGALTPPNHC